MDGAEDSSTQTPSLFSDSLEKYLEQYMDMGLSEWQFWDMTIAELENYARSYERVQKRKAQEQALADYQLANLIGYSVARIYSKDLKYPEIYDVYPAFFDKEAILEARQKEKDKETFDWLKQFAESFNKSNDKEVKEIANE